MCISLETQEKEKNRGYFIRFYSFIMFSACTCGIRTNFFVRKWEFLGLFSGEVWEHHRHHPRRHHLRRHHHRRHHPRTNLSRKTYPENAFESVGPLRLLSVLSSILMYDCLCLFVCLFVCGSLVGLVWFVALLLSFSSMLSPSSSRS